MGQEIDSNSVHSDLDSSERRTALTHEDPTPAISVRGLTKRYRRNGETLTAVDDVSFSVEPGSVVGLLGPNGAGKTTTIKSILGIILPDSGTVRIFGYDVQQNPLAVYPLVDAMLEGARNDYWRLTVRENLKYFATLGGIDPSENEQRYSQLLDVLDLEEWGDEPVRNLSRGMKQRVSLASVLASGSPVVFLDEPTLGLDIESSLTLRQELRRIVDDRGLTAIVSSHDMGVIEDICDRVIIMQDGGIVADDSVTSLLSRSELGGVRIASDDFTDQTIEALRSRFPVVQVEEAESGARIEIRTDSDGVYDLMGFLEKRDVTLTSIESSESKLEDVFLELTRAPGHD